MSFSLNYGSRFIKQAKRLTKKYASFTADLHKLGASLLANPQLGESLGQSCYKVRMALTSKGRGKSGGARVITLVRVEAERIVLLSVYDKSERENLDPGELDALLAEAGLPAE